MLVEAPISHIDRENLSPEKIDWLDLNWWECAKRALQRDTRGGRNIRILLRIGCTLHHGDILQKVNGEIVAINVLPCEVIVVQPRNATELAVVAYRLGDLHVPVEAHSGCIIAVPDGPTEAAIHLSGAPFVVEERRFEPALRSSADITFSNQFVIKKVSGKSTDKPSDS